MKAKTQRLYHWATEKANSKSAPLWIVLLFSLEIFLFIPLDAVLLFFGLQNRKKVFTYVAIAAFASTLSGLLGYFLGHFLWETIGSYIVGPLISPALFEKISSHLIDYEQWGVFLGSLLPFPLKALGLAAGVFHLPLFPFLIYLLTARLLRFTLVGSAVAFWGDKVKAFLDKHFHHVLLLISVKIGLALVFFWWIAS